MTIKNSRKAGFTLVEIMIVVAKFRCYESGIRRVLLFASACLQRRNLYLKVYWSHGTTTTNFGVAWAMVAIAQGDGENMDAATASSEQVVTDTGGSTSRLYISAASSALTILNTPVAGDLAFFRVYRKPSHASDTMAIDARLHGVLLSFG